MEKNYEVVDYEVGGADYGDFATFEEAKNYADKISAKLNRRLSVIEFDEDGNGEETYSTCDCEADRV